MKEYMTIQETAQIWNVSERWVQRLCREKKIEGAVKFGHAWAIPRSTEKPADSRVKSGRYINWRKNITNKDDGHNLS